MPRVTGDDGGDRVNEDIRGILAVEMGVLRVVVIPVCRPCTLVDHLIMPENSNDNGEF